MFPILNKYIANELKNSKYCKENFLDEQNGEKPKKKAKKKKKKGNNALNNAVSQANAPTTEFNINNNHKNESNKIVNKNNFHDDENFDSACF